MSQLQLAWTYFRNLCSPSVALKLKQVFKVGGIGFSMGCSYPERKIRIVVSIVKVREHSWG